MPNDEAPTEPKRRPLASRRIRLALGLAGLAVVGAGAYAVTDNLTGRDAETTAGTSVPPGKTDAGQVFADSVPGEVAPTTQPSSAGPSASATSKAAEPKTDAERVKAAKSFAAAHGVKNFHPVLPRQMPELTAAAENAKVRTTGSTAEGRTMRIITAEGDLTGQRELGWVAGGITKMGEVSCSQTFQLANEEKPGKKPSLLVCWRTSATKSVATVAVNLRGKPSQKESVEVIGREWRKLG